MRRSAQARGKGADGRALGVLQAGHLLTDLHLGIPPALLPFLTSERGLSLASAGTPVLAATVSPSALQVAMLVVAALPVPGVVLAVVLPRAADHPYRRANERSRSRQTTGPSPQPDHWEERS